MPTSDEPRKFTVHVVQHTETKKYHVGIRDTDSGDMSVSDQCWDKEEECITALEKWLVSNGVVPSPMMRVQ